MISPVKAPCFYFNKYNEYAIHFLSKHFVQIIEYLFSISLVLNEHVNQLEQLQLLFMQNKYEIIIRTSAGIAPASLNALHKSVKDAIVPFYKILGYC